MNCRPKVNCRNIPRIKFGLEWGHLLAETMPNINPPNHLLVEPWYYNGDGSKITLLPSPWKYHGGGSKKSSIAQKA